MTTQLSLTMEEKKRLGKQLESVRYHMLRLGGWRTLAEIVRVISDWDGITASEAGVSARLRDLRKLGYTVDKRLRSGSLWEYKVSK